MNTATNRQIVQEGLDRRAALRKEAALEAQARKLRIIINDNHILKTTGKAPARIPESRQTAAKTEPRRMDHRQEDRAERAAEASYCADWYGYLLRVFTPLLIAAATLGLSANDVLPLQVTAPFAIVACLIALEAFAARFLHTTN